MTELKTLKELADEHGFPFEAVCEIGPVKFYGINLAGDGVVGQRIGERRPDTWSIDNRHWTLSKKQQTAASNLSKRLERLEHAKLTEEKKWLYTFAGQAWRTLISAAPGEFKPEKYAIDAVKCARALLAELEKEPTDE